MKLETSPKVTKSKRSLHWCRSISKKISVQVLLQYQSKSYYIIGQEVFYSIGRFITLSGSYYIIGRLLHYRLVQECIPEQTLHINYRYGDASVFCCLHILRGYHHDRFLVFVCLYMIWQ